MQGMLQVEDLRKFGRCLLKGASTFPEEVQFEVTNRCNYDCPMCPREHLPQKDMDFDLFSRAIQRVPWAKQITLTGWGEPMVHKRFFELAELARRAVPAARLRFTTNGFYLKPDAIDRLLAIGFDQINVSMEAVDQGEPPAYGYGHPTESRIAQNVRELMRRRGPRPLPRVRLQTVMGYEGLKNLLDIVEFCADARVDLINLVRLDIRDHPEQLRPSRAEERTMLAAVRRAAARHGIPVVNVNDQNLMVRLAGHFDHFCLRLDNYLYINVDGEITPCCSMPRYRLGHIDQDDLAEVWEGEKLADFRRRHNELCGKCDTLKYNHLI
jgi:MoaA/NifB/PqqE/SkfB family radical SAM enzyme